jgi:hypothetical protein
MNEGSGAAPQFEVPREQPKTPESSGEQRSDKTVEQAHPASQETGVGKAAPQPGSTAAADIDQIQQDPVTIPDDTAQLPPAATPVSPATKGLQAHDADLIEKEWVHRAKNIVEKTHDDPHRQKSEMSKVKADYIQKRFKKIIKTDETATA